MDWRILLGAFAFTGSLFIPALLTHAMFRFALELRGRYDKRARKTLTRLTVAYPVVTATLLLAFQASPGLTSIGIILTVAPMSVVAAAVLLRLSRSVTLAATPILAAAACIALDQHWGPNGSGHHHACEASIPLWLGIVFLRSVVWTWVASFFDPHWRHRSRETRSARQQTRLGSKRRKLSPILARTISGALSHLDFEASLCVSALRSLRSLFASPRHSPPRFRPCASVSTPPSMMYSPISHLPDRYGSTLNTPVMLP